MINKENNSNALFLIEKYMIIKYLLNARTILILNTLQTEITVIVTQFID